jgi:hypothetical protein
MPDFINRCGSKLATEKKLTFMEQKKMNIESVIVLIGVAQTNPLGALILILGMVLFLVLRRK